MRKFYASAIRSKVINSSPKPALGDTVTLDIDGTTHVALVAQDHDLSCAGCLLYNRDPAIICPVDIEGLLLCGKIHAIFKPLDNLMEDI